MLNKKFTEANPESTTDVTTSVVTETPLQFMRELGAFLNQQMVWYEGASLDFRVRAYFHSRWDNKATPLERAADRDPEKVLKIVSEQTGLVFTKERRNVQILHVTTPQPKP